MNRQGAVRPGEAGPRGRRVRKTPETRKSRPAGANPARPKPQPGRSEVSLATGSVTASAMRRRTGVWAVGRVPRNGGCPGCPRRGVSGRPQRSPGPRRRRAPYPAGSGTTARTQEGGPGTWEAPALAREGVGQRRGRPEPRPRVTGASEGSIRAQTTGNGRHPDPSEQRDARVGVSFRRATWPAQGRREACHRNC